MTATPPPAQLWSTMPGWGIAADLTPPELINSRALKTLRKWLGAGLVVLLLACIAGLRGRRPAKLQLRPPPWTR